MGYVRDIVEQMGGYTPGFQPRGQRFVKLNTNENPYPPSPRAVEAMRRACGESIRKYPPPLADRFRSMAADVLGVGAEEILCGFGSDDLLNIAVRTFCEKGDVLAFPHPSYSLYEVLAGIQGARSVMVDFPEDFSLPRGLEETGAKLTLLANPNAPSGTLIGPEEIRRLAGRIQGVLLVDEAYADFAHENCLPLVRDCRNLVVTRTFSKAYSLAGLRFGFAVANKEFIKQMTKVKDSYNVSAPGVAGASAAIEDQQWLEKNIGKIKGTRKKLVGGLEGFGFHCWPSEANFVLARVPEDACAETIYNRLFEQKILVRYFKQPRLDDCLRITVGTDAEIDRFLEGLEDIMQET